MATLSPARKAVMVLQGLELLHRGKVRDTYMVDPKKGLLLQVVTDGVSVFDFTLNATVALKGIILAALSVFLFKKMEEKGIKTHLVAYGAGIDRYLPEHLRGNADLQSRALIVRKCEMIPVEFVFRSCLTGSFMKPEKRGGNILPEGMQEGDQFPTLVFNPTDKAEEGHDEPLNFREVEAQYPEATKIARSAYQLVSEELEERGLKLVDGKLEMSVDGVVCDEPPTLDAARILDDRAWHLSRLVKGKRTMPPTQDKEFVRAFGKTQGLPDLDPRNPEHVARVHGIVVPAEVLLRTTEIYRYAFWRITGMQIETYLRSEMGVKNAPVPTRKRVAILCGSESDLPALDEALDQAAFNHDYFVHVISCHRNSFELLEFARGGCGCANLVICVGGKAFALPGVLAAYLREAGFSIPVAGVALGAPDSSGLQAALLSISQLPDNPVVMDESWGTYNGTEGIVRVLERVEYGEFPPPRPVAAKSAKYRVRSNCD